jgi:hypothetical protein
LRPAECAVLPLHIKGGRPAFRGWEALNSDTITPAFGTVPAIAKSYAVPPHPAASPPAASARESIKPLIFFTSPRADEGRRSLQRCSHCWALTWVQPYCQVQIQLAARAHANLPPVSCADLPLISRELFSSNREERFAGFAERPKQAFVSHPAKACLESFAFRRAFSQNRIGHFCELCFDHPRGSMTTVRRMRERVPLLCTAPRRNAHAAANCTRCLSSPQPQRARQMHPAPAAGAIHDLNSGTKSLNIPE